MARPGCAAHRPDPGAHLTMHDVYQVDITALWQQLNDTGNVALPLGALGVQQVNASRDPDWSGNDTYTKRNGNGEALSTSIVPVEAYTGRVVGVADSEVRLFFIEGHMQGLVLHLGGQVALDATPGPPDILNVIWTTAEDPSAGAAATVDDLQPKALFCNWDCTNPPHKDLLVVMIADKAYVDAPNNHRAIMSAAARLTAQKMRAELFIDMTWAFDEVPDLPTPTPNTCAQLWQDFTDSDIVPSPLPAQRVYQLWSGHRPPDPDGIDPYDCRGISWSDGDGTVSRYMTSVIIATVGRDARDRTHPNHDYDYDNQIMWSGYHAVQTMYHELAHVLGQGDHIDDTLALNGRGDEMYYYNVMATYAVDSAGNPYGLHAADRFHSMPGVAEMHIRNALDAAGWT